MLFSKGILENIKSKFNKIKTDNTGIKHLLNKPITQCRPFELLLHQ